MQTNYKEIEYIDSNEYRKIFGYDIQYPINECKAKVTITKKGEDKPLGFMCKAPNGETYYWLVAEGRVFTLEDYKTGNYNLLISMA